MKTIFAAAALCSGIASFAYSAEPMVIFVGTTPGHPSDGVITASSEGVFHGAGMAPYGYVYDRPLEGRVDTFIQIYMNTDLRDAEHNGKMYGRVTPKASGILVGYLSVAQIPNGKPVYKADGCTKSWQNGLLWTRNQTYDTCARNDRIGYLKP